MTIVFIEIQYTFHFKKFFVQFCHVSHTTVNKIFTVNSYSLHKPILTTTKNEDPLLTLHPHVHFLESVKGDTQRHV